MRRRVQVSRIGFDPLKFATHFYAQDQGTFDDLRVAQNLNAR